VRELFNDLAILGGGAAVAAGAWDLARPAGLIVGGVLLVLFGS